MGLWALSKPYTLDLLTEDTTRIMPSLAREEVDLLIEKAKGIRDKSIIALFAESGHRLSELINYEDRRYRLEFQCD
jgi:site-specific recombinase XerC